MRLIGIILLAIPMLLEKSYAQCGSYPVLNLGNDVNLCQGQSVNFTVPAGYDYFTWNIVSGNPTTVNVNSTQSVVLQVQNYSTTDLVINGDFEAGNTGFTSGYAYPTSPPIPNCCGLLSNPGNYAITTDPHNVHSNFITCSDHGTGAPGNMMVVNGSDIPNTIVWAETITVDPNTNYNFSVWATSLQSIASTDVAHLQFFINNVQVGNLFSPSLLGCDWQHFFEVWSSGVSTTANISIVAQSIAGYNDFALDDISFIPVCVQSDTVQVTLDPGTIDAGPDVAFCQNETGTLTASANFANPSLTWETGATTATITPTTTGYYTVSTTTPGGCPISDSALATVTPMPWDFDLVQSQPTTCGPPNGAVFTTMSGTFNDPPYYTWNGPGASNPSFIHASVWTNLSPGWYYIEVESDGCYRHDSVYVDVSNPPVAVMSATPLSGYAPLNVNFTNSSTDATNYVWNFGNGNTTTATDLTGQSQTYTDPGTYTAYLVAVQGNCTDTAFVTIVVSTPPPPPIPPIIVPVDLSYPNIFTPDGDAINDFFEFTVLNIKSLHIDVVNRWGDLVYSSNDVNFKWDGKSNGTPLNDGVYTFMFTATGAQEEHFEGQGFVHLIR